MSQAESHAPRLAVLLSHPTQYYSPWFRWVATHTALTLRVFYLWDFGVTEQRDRNFDTKLKWDIDLLSGYDHEFVPNTAAVPGTHHFGGLRNPGLTARLAAWHPDALLMFGYKSASHLRALLWARIRGVPVFFRGDSHFLGRGTPGLLAQMPLRILYKQFRGALYVGAANRNYFSTLGMPQTKLFQAPHSVNEELFDPARAENRIAADELRAKLKLAADIRVVLFAGKLIPAKQPVELLRAFLAVRSPQAALVVVGEGSEKAALLEIARKAPRGAVHFLPFANQTEMPARFLLADIFALPSRGFYETWGLAVNEAMHMGVPALVSDRVGCQRDLVTDGATGWVFAADDATSLVDKLAEALRSVGDPTKREALRAAVTTRIHGYTYAHTTAGLLRALGSLRGAGT